LFYHCIIYIANEGRHVRITIISWNYFNLTVTNEYVGDSQYQPRLSSITNVAPADHQVRLQ